MLRRPTPGIQRAAVVLLLLGGAYLAIRPFAGCAFPFGRCELDFARICAFGFGSADADRYGPGPQWPYVVVAGIYAWAEMIRSLRDQLKEPAPDALPVKRSKPRSVAVAGAAK